MDSFLGLYLHRKKKILIIGYKTILYFLKLENSGMLWYMWNPEKEERSRCFLVKKKKKIRGFTNSLSRVENKVTLWKWQTLQIRNLFILMWMTLCLLKRVFRHMLQFHAILPLFNKKFLRLKFHLPKLVMT